MLRVIVCHAVQVLHDDSNSHPGSFPFPVLILHATFTQPRRTSEPRRKSTSLKSTIASGQRESFVLQESWDHRYHHKRPRDILDQEENLQKARLLLIEKTVLEILMRTETIQKEAGYASFSDVAKVHFANLAHEQKLMHRNAEKKRLAMEQAQEARRRNYLKQFADANTGKGMLANDTGSSTPPKSTGGGFFSGGINALEHTLEHGPESTLELAHLHDSAKNAHEVTKPGETSKYAVGTHEGAKRVPAERNLDGVEAV